MELERKEAAAAARASALQMVGGGVLGARRDRRRRRRHPRRRRRRRRRAGGRLRPARAPAPTSSSRRRRPPTYDEAAKAAGCTLTNAKYEGANHEEKDFTPADYKTNPPTSGNHFPDWYDDGVYEPGTTDNLGMLVHTLEHGRINIQYKKGTPADVVAKLEALYDEQNEGYHMLLFENTTDMEPQVAATAWTHSLTCPKMNDKVFDAIRTFRARYIDKGPETVP